MSEERRIEFGSDGVKRVVVGNSDKELNNETNRAIRKVMEIIETYTNYNELDNDRRNIVRETVLNQINRVVRVSKHKQTMVFGGSDNRG